MNNSDFPNAAEDLHDFLSHPQHWAGTEVFLQLGDNTEVMSVLHYSPLIDKYFWRPITNEYSPTHPRIGKGPEICAQLVEEGWVLANA